MGRKVLAVVVAMVTAVAIIWVGWMLSTIVAPHTPKNLEYLSVQDIDAYAHSLPTGSYVLALVCYAAAAFAGGFISTKMGRRWSEGISLALLVGALLTVGSVVAAIIWPQPVWFILASLVVFIPVSLFGYKLAANAFPPHQI